jgi:hypothetical protein
MNKDMQFRLPPGYSSWCHICSGEPFNKTTEVEFANVLGEPVKYKVPGVGFKTMKEAKEHELQFHRVWKGQMSRCWHCYWGMSKPVKAVYDKYLALLDGDDTALNYGPGHIVWDDENMSDDHIQWCIDEAEKWNTHEWDKDWPTSMKRDGPTFSSQVLQIAIDSLKELKQVPEKWRLEPENYDGEHPENFPPPEGW